MQDLVPLAAPPPPPPPGLKVWVPVRDAAGWIVAEVVERRDAEVVLARRWPETDDAAAQLL
eukprot:7308249-Prymnesium_polylepis.1